MMWDIFNFFLKKRLGKRNTLDYLNVFSAPTMEQTNLLLPAMGRNNYIYIHTQEGEKKKVYLQIY